MDIFDIGVNELLVISLLAAILLGPERLARSARVLGRLIRNLKMYLNSLSDELKTELDLLDDLKEIQDELER